MSSIADFTEVFTINTFAKPPSAAFQLNFLRDIQWLLESSSYTSTYKFALLMALANLSIESGIDDNSPHTISYRQLAEQFMQLYWLQAIPLPRKMKILYCDKVLPKAKLVWLRLF